MTTVVGLYKIQVPDGLCYVGQSIDVNRRIRCHAGMLRKGTHYNKHLQRAYNKHKGSVKYLVASFPKQHLDEAEQLAIDLTYGASYNKAKYVVRRGEMTEELKAKLSVAISRLHQTEEHRAKVNFAKQTILAKSLVATGQLLLSKSGIRQVANKAQTAYQRTGQPYTKVQQVARNALRTFDYPPPPMH